jgi:hypothetical protein
MLRVTGKWFIYPLSNQIVTTLFPILGTNNHTNSLIVTISHIPTFSGSFIESWYYCFSLRSSHGRQVRIQWSDCTLPIAHFTWADMTLESWIHSSLKVVQIIRTNLYMKSTIFWDITPCSPMKVNRRFGGTSPPSTGSKNKPFSRWFLAQFILWPWRWRPKCSSKTSVDFHRTSSSSISLSRDRSIVSSTALYPRR